jgi:hypothetical protein
MGVRHANGSKGDLIAEVQIVLPDTTDAAAVERRLADAPFECAFPRWEIEARTDVASEHPHPRQLQVPAPRPECLERPRSPVWG